MVEQNNFRVQRVDNDSIEIFSDQVAYRLSPDNDFELVPQYLTQAILLEVCTSPKPGLVTRNSNGSHKDMSIFTFAMSSAVLSRAFNDLYLIGLEHYGKVSSLLNKVRVYGIEAEKELLRVTKGVNTQRGILFAGGLLSAAAGYVSNKKNTCRVIDIINVVKDMTRGLVKNELAQNNAEPVTAGEKLYRYYSITGIRGEVEKGFPSVILYGLPALSEAFSKGASVNDALVHALMSLMTVVEDSNVIWRTDIITAEEVKKCASAILKKGSVFTDEGKKAILAACQFFEKKRISPGGCADLLSVTVCLYLLENKEFPNDVF